MTMPTGTSDAAKIAASTRGFGPAAYLACLSGIVWREILRYLHQRERFLSALVRPLFWLLIFAAGFRQSLGVSIIPPYETYVLYEVYVLPGLIGMILLFNAMQSSLSMVYDRETGAMRTLLVSPFPRSFLLASKLLGGVSVGLLQALVFLIIARIWEAWTWDSAETFLGTLARLPHNLLATLSQMPSVDPPAMGYVYALPAMLLAGLMLGALGLLMSSLIRQLENFAGVMNFVIFPMFFASSALYPLWRIREASPGLYEVCRLNPFTHAVELIRFALYGQLDTTALAVCLGFTALFLLGAIYAYNPSKGLIGRRGGPGGGGA
jgi:ABC-2 type transport system permease protein